MHRSYLDHASTSPVRPAALEAMIAQLRAVDGSTGADPGRIHHEGMMSRVALEQAREQLAALVGARPREVVFTSGATESIAAAHFGALQREGSGGGVVASSVEHSAVREWAERGRARAVGVDRLGRIDVDELLDQIDDTTAIVDVQWGNHEVGTLQPVAEVVERCRERGVLVHVDAAQAVGHVPVDFRALGADLLSLSGHKFGAPPGSGALLVRRGVRLPPLLVGGDQERARRAGMENVAAAVGLGAAAAELLDTLGTEEATARRLTSRIVDWAETAEGVVVLGDPDGRVPHLVCLGIEGIEPQPVLMGLDRAGIAVHSGSSCSSESLEPSPVLEAMGVDAERSLRISTGWSTTDADVDRLLVDLPAVLDALRAYRQ
ncbi:MAG: cysteine desulfurase [Actinomycetota bacterium]|nr:cysteine desulfurase [Actinomycetota bacterium]